MVTSGDIEGISFRTFIRLCIKEAWRTSWEKSDTATAIAALVIGVIVHFVPQWEQAMTNIWWQVPIAALASVVVMRILLSPFMIYRKRDKDARIAEREIEKARLTQPNIGATDYGTVSGQQGCGLIVSNPGYASRNVHIPTVPIGLTTCELEFPRWMGQLLIHDHNQLFRARIKQAEQTVDGDRLFDVMEEHKVESIPLAIKFQDDKDKWHQRKLSIKKNRTVDGGFSIISGAQEPIPPPPSFTQQL